MTITPQLTLPAVNGTLILGHGTEQVEFPLCRVDMSSIHVTTSGHIQRVRIFDRRVWWQHAYIDGAYNLTNPDGTFRTDSQKSARDLATLLLEEMGESGFDVSVLPDDDYPFVNWDCFSARSALASLCERHGCDVDLDWASDSVRIVKLGQGAALPNHADNVSVSIGVDVAEAPGSVKVCCNYDLYQSKLKLVAVGIDTDGSLKLLKDLSYAPDAAAADGGWADAVANPVDPLMGGEELERHLARKSVYRYFLVDTQADGTLDVPGRDGKPALTKIEQILPLRDKLVNTYEDDDEIQKEHEAFLSGRFLMRDQFNNNVNSDPCSKVEGIEVSLDAEIGLIRTDHPLVKLDDNDKYQPADLFLTTSYNVQDVDTFQYERYSVSQTIGPNPGVHAEQAPSIQRTFRAEYDETSEDCATVSNVVDNSSTVTADVNARLQQMLEQFQTRKSAQVIYRSIKRMFLDGARRQITWIVSDESGAKTIATFNAEPSFGTLRSKERKRLLLAEDDRDKWDAEQIRLRRIKRKGKAL